MRNNYWMALFVFLACLFLGIVTHKAHSAELSMCGPLADVTERLAEEGEQPILAFVYDVNVEVPQMRIMFASKDTYTLVVGSADRVCTMYNGEVLGVNLPSDTDATGRGPGPQGRANPLQDRSE